MNATAEPNRYATHVVTNQARPATGFNAFDGDKVLTAAIQREAPWAADRCSALGRLAGDEGVQELARLANRNLPELKTHDRYGNRIDWVEFHPAWHELMDACLAARSAFARMECARAASRTLRARCCVSLEPGRARDRLPDRDGLRRACRIRVRTRIEDLGGKGQRERNTSSAGARSPRRRPSSSATR